MSVCLFLSLFGKPGQELTEGGDVTAQDLRDLAQDLKARLEAAADVLEKLTATGWEAEMALYDVILSHPYVATEAEARLRLDDLGIDPERLSILENEDDEIDEEDSM